MNRELERIALDLERQGKRREALALRAVARAYDTVRLVDVAALLNAYTELPTAARRMAGLEAVMGAFQSAVSVLHTPPAELTVLLTEAVRSGTVAGAAMLNAQVSTLNAFRVDPVRETEYARHAAARLTRYWGVEGVRLANETQSVLLEGLERGQSSRQMAARLRERVTVSRSRANLIARNEVGNAASYAQRESQLEAGSTHYVWRSAQDSRVRDLHAQYDGQVFAWDDDFEDSPPGSAVLCRCVALALPPGQNSL